MLTYRQVFAPPVLALAPLLFFQLATEENMDVFQNWVLATPLKSYAQFASDHQPSHTNQLAAQGLYDRCYTGSVSALQTPELNGSRYEAAGNDQVTYIHIYANERVYNYVEHVSGYLEAIPEMYDEAAFFNTLHDQRACLERDLNVVSIL